MYLVCRSILPYLLHVAPYSKIAMYCVQIYSTSYGRNIGGALPPQTNIRGQLPPLHPCFYSPECLKQALLKTFGTYHSCFPTAKGTVGRSLQSSSQCTRLSYNSCREHYVIENKIRVTVRVVQRLY